MNADAGLRVLSSYLSSWSYKAIGVFVCEGDLETIKNYRYSLICQQQQNDPTLLDQPSSYEILYYIFLTRFTSYPYYCIFLEFIHVKGLSSVVLDTLRYLRQRNKH